MYRPRNPCQLPEQNDKNKSTRTIDNLNRVQVFRNPGLLLTHLGERPSAVVRRRVAHSWQPRATECVHRRCAHSCHSVQQAGPVCCLHVHFRPRSGARAPRPHLKIDVAARSNELFRDSRMPASGRQVWHSHLRPARPRYSLYLLYWHKSSDTDAEALCC